MQELFKNANIHFGNQGGFQQGGFGFPGDLGGQGGFTKEDIEKMSQALNQQGGMGSQAGGRMLVSQQIEEQVSSGPSGTVRRIITTSNYSDGTSETTVQEVPAGGGGFGGGPGLFSSGGGASPLHHLRLPRSSPW